MPKERREYVVFQNMSPGRYKRLGTTMAVSEKHAVNNVWYKLFASQNMPEAVKIRPDIFAVLAESVSLI